MKFKKADCSQQLVTLTVPKEEWNRLRKDVQELKEICNGMAKALTAVADGASVLSNSPLGKMLGNMFPES
jgi:hypothetical protein